MTQSQLVKLFDMLHLPLFTCAFYMTYDSTKPYKTQILNSIENTWNTPYVKVTRGLYPIIRKKFSCPEIQHTDGIGTKGIYHWHNRTFNAAVQDALAMNLNDLLMIGATTYALQNHIILPKDDHKAIKEIIAAFVIETKKRNIAMTGGETSIHNNIDGLDLSVTISGILIKERSNTCINGDILIGLKSNGLHSNGITAARNIPEVVGEYGNEFTKPTYIYSDLLLPFLETHKINGMMHITGGAFSKLKDILPRSLDIVINQNELAPQDIFIALSKKFTDNQMYTTFNCGIGFVLSVPKDEVSNLLIELKEFEAAEIGTLVPGTGSINLTSAFSGQKVTL